MWKRDEIRAGRKQSAVFWVQRSGELPVNSDEWKLLENDQFETASIGIDNL